MNIMKEWLDDYNEAEEYSKVKDTKKITLVNVEFNPVLVNTLLHMLVIAIAHRVEAKPY